MSEYKIIGGGVSGLLTVFSLLEKGVSPKSIRVIAEFYPGDITVKYASPLAGAYFCPSSDASVKKYADYTYQNIDKVLRFLADYENPGLNECYATEVFETPLTETESSLVGKGIDEFRFLSKEELDKIGPGLVGGYHCRSLQWNSPVFLSNLYEKFKLLGVVFERRKLGSLYEVLDNTTKAVFNCTGTGSATLGGVKDEKVRPVRGQVIVVRAPHIKLVYTRWGAGSSTYIIPRIGSQMDEVILGGFYEHNNGDISAYAHQSQDILQRTTELCPRLLLENATGNRIQDLQILRVVVGIRPGREGGPRLESEIINGKQVIHNYGACGEGYILGLGLAHSAVELLLSKLKL